MPHTEDRAVLALRSELGALHRAVLPATVPIPPRRGSPQSQVGAIKGKPTAYDRDRQTIHHLVEAFTTTSKTNYLDVVSGPMLIVDAWLLSIADFAADAAHYSTVDLQERAAGGTRKIAHISSEPRTVGEWATGDIVAGQPYRFALVANPRVSLGSVLEVAYSSQDDPGTMPDAWLIVHYRYEVS